MTVAEKVQMNRRRRIRSFIKVLKANEGNEVNKAIAWFAVSTGLREKVIREYLKLLVQAEIVVIENGIIKQVKEEEALF